MSRQEPIYEDLDESWFIFSFKAHTDLTTIFLSALLEGLKKNINIEGTNLILHQRGKGDLGSLTFVNGQGQKKKC